MHKYVHVVTRTAPLCLFNAQKVPWRSGFETPKRQNYRICPIVCGCKKRPMGQDPRAILAGKLDFQRVILKKFGALRALVRKRGGSPWRGADFWIPPKKTVCPPEPTVSRRVASTGDHPGPEGPSRPAERGRIIIIIIIIIIQF